jgi:hypothetical protein
MNNGFNNIQNEWFNSYVNANSSINAKRFTNPFKYRYETLMCVSIYINKCNMQRLNSDFNKLKVLDSTHVKMWIIQKMWKNH